MGGRQHPLSEFQRLCGWTEPEKGQGGAPEALLARCEEWFEKNEAALRWEPQRSRFVGAFPPDKAALGQALAALPPRYGIKADDIVGTGQYGVTQVFGNLSTLVQNDKEAAADPAVAEAMAALLEPALNSKDFMLAGRICTAVSKINRGTGAKAWARLLEAELTGSDMFSNLTTLDRRFPGYDPAAVREARAQLLPVMKKQYEEADAQKKPGERLRRLMAYLYVGGTVEMTALEQAIGAAQGDEAFRFPFVEWAEAVVRMRNTAGLRLLLAAAKQTPNMRAFAMTKFEYLSGLSDERGRYFGGQDAEARVAARRKWLEANEKDLPWNEAEQRFKSPTTITDVPFAGARPPGPPDAVRPPGPPDAVRPPVPPKAERDPQAEF
ncbi:MAG: hypothetical protein NTW87_33205 [Planctomycetota bacterium]|nr:hypothetical protein [Planctomycetota bacterium]